MKRRNRNLAVFMSAVMAGTLLAGCGGQKNKEQTQAQTREEQAETTQTQKGGEMSASSGDAVEVTFWDQNASETRTQIFSHLIEEFEKENPDIKINFVPIPASDAKAKYDVAIQSNTAPDCGGVSQYWMSDFIVQDALVALDDYIAQWEDAEYMLDMYQQSIKDMAPDGKTYALANTVTLPTVWLNNQMLETAGKDIPKDWLEVCRLAQELTDKGSGQYGFSIRGGAGSS